MFAHLYDKSIGDLNEVVLYFIIYDFPPAPRALAYRHTWTTSSCIMFMWVKVRAKCKPMGINFKLQVFREFREKSIPTNFNCFKLKHLCNLYL